MTNHTASGGSDRCGAAKGAAGETKQHSVSAQKPSVSDQKKNKHFNAPPELVCNLITFFFLKCSYFENVEDLRLYVVCKEGALWCHTLVTFSGQIRIQHL